MHNSQTVNRATALLVGLAMALVLPAAHAVVKNVAIVGGDGIPVAQSTVTIVFPDGTQEQAETDDNGILIFDFPGDGDYMIRYSGGEMTFAVAGGVPTMAIVGGVIAAAAGVAMLGGSDSDSQPNSSSVSSPSNGGDTSGGNPGGDTDGDTGGDDASVDGTYDASTSVLSNPDNHPDHFATATFTVTSNGSTVTVQGSGSNLSFTVSGSLTNGTDFSGAADGNYAGFGTVFQVQITFDPATDTWSGEMDAGSDGALPDSNNNGSNEAIRVMFQGSR